MNMRLNPTLQNAMNEEYITKSEAIEAACNAVELFPSEYREIENAINRIAAADVMEVVRCRECKYSHEDEIFGNRWCESHSGCRKVKDEGFCDLGAERRC